MVEYTPDKVSVQELRALAKYLVRLEEGSPIPLVSLPLSGSKKQAKRVLDYFVTEGAVLHSLDSPYVLSDKSRLAEIMSSGYKKARSPLVTSLAGVEVDMPSYGDISRSKFGFQFRSSEDSDRLARLEARAQVGLIKIMSRCPNGIARDDILRVHAHKGSYASRGDLYDRNTQTFYNEILQKLEKGRLIIVDQEESDVPTLFPNGSNTFRLNMENEEGLVEIVENFRGMHK